MKIKQNAIILAYAELFIKTVKYNGNQISITAADNFSGWERYVSMLHIMINSKTRYITAITTNAKYKYLTKYIMKHE